MLMNHKNFCFTEIPDKTNDVIFLKSPKPLFKLWLTRGTIYDPLIPCKFRGGEKTTLMSQFQDNLRTDGKIEGQALFYFIGPF